MDQPDASRSAPLINIEGDLIIRLPNSEPIIPLSALFGAARETITARRDSQPQTSTASNTVPMKILADWTPVPVEDPRTDHVAVMFPGGTLVHVNSLGRDNNTRPFATQQDAEAAAAALDVLGRKWELALPVDILRYVIDYNRHSPAFDTSLYPGLKTDDWTWSGQHCTWSKDAAGVASHAFYANLYYGSVNSYHRGVSGFGLAVSRPGQ